MSALDSVAINLQVDLDLEAWSRDYGLDNLTQARADFKEAIAQFIEYHLTDTLGFAATVSRK